MHRSPREPHVRAPAGHTFKDDTTEWQQKGTHRISQTIQLTRWMANENKLRCAPQKLYFYISYSQSQCTQWTLPTFIMGCTKHYLYNAPIFSYQRSFVSCGGALSTGCDHVAARFGRVCSTTGYITSGLRGPSPPGFNPLRRGWVYRPAPEVPGVRKGLGFGPANADGVRGIFGTASGLRGPSPQALTLFGGVGFIAWRLRRPEKGNACWASALRQDPP